MKEIMTRAWEIAKEAAAKFGGKAKQYISGALKAAWAEAKAVVMTVKEQAVATMKKLIEMAVDCYDYEIVTNDWVKYGKNRTYLAIIETSKNSKHYAKYDCGYVDNNTNTYVAGKTDLNKRFTLSGARY